MSVESWFCIELKGETLKNFRWEQKKRALPDESSSQVTEKILANGADLNDFYVISDCNGVIVCRTFTCVPVKTIVDALKDFGDFSLIWASSDCEEYDNEGLLDEEGNLELNDYMEDCCGYYRQRGDQVSFGLGMEPKTKSKLLLCSQKKVNVDKIIDQIPGLTSKKVDKSLEKQVETNPLNIRKPADVLLSDGLYKPWSGAASTWQIIVDNNKIEDLKKYLLKYCPADGVSPVELNDMLWFDWKKVFKDIGLGYIKPNAESINKKEFVNYKKLESITVPESVKTIGAEAFSGCSKLTNIIIPEEVNCIGSKAFYKCKSLKTIILPKNLKEIEELTFYHCTSLTSVTIPKGVTSIKKDAFSDCNALSEIVYNGTKEEWNLIDKTDSGIETCKIMCVDGVIVL